jgi:succinoglycan biosynthesis protein ExoV
MKVFYYKDKKGNFGDDLNEWLWKEILPDLCEEKDDGKLLVGIGTILGLELPKGKWQKKVIGSGVGYGPLPSIDESWEFLAVRGPLSARALSLDPKIAVTDSAALLRTLPRYSTPRPSRKGVVFMPHISASPGKWEKACEIAGITYLSPRWDSKLLLEKIANAELVLADAMHAAICADTLRVPWVPLATSDEISTFKWVDWTLSLDLPYRPIYLSASSVLEWLRHKTHFFLGYPQRVPYPIIEEINKDPTHTGDILLAYFEKNGGNSPRRKTILSKTKLFLRLNIVRAISLINRMSFLHLLWKPLDIFLMHHAAAHLKKAANETGYLSDEVKLDAAIARLGTALTKIK